MKFVGPWTVHICTVHCRKSTFAVTVHWTVTAILQNAWKPKKKKKRTKRSLETQTLNPNTHEFPKKKRLWWHNANKKQNPQNTIFGLLNFSPYILVAINFGPFYFQLSIHFRRKMFVHSLNFEQVAKIHMNFYIGQFTA